MAFTADVARPDRQRSPPATLPLNGFSSNNPFRNRAVSPAPSPINGAFTPDSPTRSRPVSTNPFLDNDEYPNTVLKPARDDKQSGVSTAVPDDIFSQLSLLDNSRIHPSQAPRDLQNPSGQAVPGRRPAGLEERRAPPRPPRGLDGPVKRDFRPAQHRRRASESSVMEPERRPRVERERVERTESEERRRRERRKEREDRHNREKERAGNGSREERSEKRHRKPRGLDIIDKLDVTGVYGQGLFHHDGPFDACNPHRNAKKDRRAPMQAFPEGSANMALGGAGPLNARLDLDRFHGRGVEGFSEYAATRRGPANIIDPLQRAEPVHGEETYGLGTSTFLEGAPASRSALQRRDSEDPAMEGTGASGLSRKKSLAQRLRGMSASRRIPPGVRSPDARYQAGSSDLDSPPILQPQIKAVSAGGPLQAKYSKENEVNPFENDYEAAFEKKGTQIRIAEQGRPAQAAPRAPGGPSALGLTRSKTSDADVPIHGRGSSNDEERPGGGGFLKRMKSLKAPRKVRSEA